MLLTPCPACRRHITGTTCPFCSHDSERVVPAPSLDGQRGRLSRALVFASAAALATGCGPKATPASPSDDTREHHHGGGGCSPPDQAEIDRLEKAKAEAPEEEKASIEADLERARQPVCMPYGAPPSRRRLV